MKWFKADLHIHSVLSPCGNLDMSPARIIQEAKNKKLDIIGITDHNSTLHSELMMRLGYQEGITVFPGIELNTKEEVHCLAFFENTEHIKKFQQFIQQSMSGILNNSGKFGMQLVVNEKEEILEEIQELLIAGLTISIDEAEKKVHEYGGMFIPAHANRPMNGILSQLGFIPDTLSIDAIELKSGIMQTNMYNSRLELINSPCITNSDAHHPDQIGSSYTEYFIEEPSFKEWVRALRGEGNRKIRLST